MEKGVLVAVEGIDGSGLTTHARLLVESLSSQGFRSVYTKEPTYGPVGQLIRKFLSLPNPDNRLLALLFAADRVWHYFEDPDLPGGGIGGALEQGYIVVTDRYKYSSIAYQGSFTSIDWVWSINSVVPEAFIIVYIDVDVDTAIKRITSRAKIEAYETRERLSIIKETFQRVLEIAKQNGVKIIHIKASEPEERTIESVSREILEKILSALENP
ncbi:MAG: dTMP kinase [Desulfurococcales archaeon]|nr:dTMP kinase [Desulfurococcales archaeon]MEB3788612.1 dTMP kinase [Desulfurococcales archaeon]